MPQIFKLNYIFCFRIKSLTYRKTTGGCIIHYILKYYFGNVFCVRLDNFIINYITG